MFTTLPAALKALNWLEWQGTWWLIVIVKDNVSLNQPTTVKD